MGTPKPDEAAIFDVARQIAAPAARLAYLRHVCGADHELLAHLEAMLQVYDAEHSFLESPARVASGPTEPASDEGVGTYIGPYKLLEVIGEGGFGVVYMAEQQQPIRRRVALKILKPGMDSRQVVARFEAERQALALMEHSNIARVLDGGETASGRPYFVMELVKGIPITRYCDEHRLTPRERLALFVPICQAVQHAHQKGIIHRDLKPSNVLIAAYDGKPVPKVIDFGVAKAMGQQLTERTLVTNFGGIVGTLEYMSPEQAEFNALDIDTRADVYSLGVLLYELLTGTTPLTKDRLKQAAMTEVLRLIREEDPPRPSTRLSDSKDTLASVSAQRQLEPARLTKEVRGELDWIVMKCLEKDRNRRYETANGVARDIEHFLNDEPVEAGPPSAIYRFRKFAWKNKRLLTPLAVFILLLLASVAVSAWLAVRATVAERQALADRDDKELARQAEAEQRRQALVEKQRADEEAAIAKAVSDFLQKDVLRQADIGNQPRAGGRQRDLTVREAFDRAAQSLEEKFPGQELTEAAIRLTLGRAYGALGEYAEAQKHLERSRTLYEQKLGIHHHDTLDAMRNLALLYHENGQFDGAERLYQQILEVGRKHLGPDDSLTLGTLSNLAYLYRVRSRYDKSESLYKEALERCRRSLGPEHYQTLEAMNNLGVLYWVCGRYDDAEPLFQEARQVSQRVLGEDHPFTLDTMNNLAMLYQDRRQFAEAEKLHKRVLELCRAKLPPDHPKTLNCKNNLASLYQALHRYAEAEPLFVEVLEASRRNPGVDHPDTLMAMNNLGALYWEMKKLDRSIPLLEEALARRRKVLDPDHPETLRTLWNLGMNYRDAGRVEDGIRRMEEAVSKVAKHPGPMPSEWFAQVGKLAEINDNEGRLEKGEALYQEALKNAQKQFGPDDPRAGNLMALLGTNQLRQKKYVDAAKTLSACLAVREKRDPQAWTTFNTKSALGGALLGEKKYAEAEPLLVQGYEGMQAREAQIPVASKIRVLQALERLVDLYTTWGQPDKAASWRTKLEAKRAEQKGEPKQPK